MLALLTRSTNALSCSRSVRSISARIWRSSFERDIPTSSPVPFGSVNYVGGQYQ